MKNKEFTSIDTIPKLIQKNIREQAATDIFRNLYDLSQIKQILTKNFTNIYLLKIKPKDIVKYKNNTFIYELAKRYQTYTENKSLDILILKRNLVMSAEVEKKYKEFKLIYGDLVQEDKREYSIIIGFSGGMTGRTNQLFIDVIQANYPVEDIH